VVITSNTACGTGLNGLYDGYGEYGLHEKMTILRNGERYCEKKRYGNTKRRKYIDEHAGSQLYMNCIVKYLDKELMNHKEASDFIIPLGDKPPTLEVIPTPRPVELVAMPLFYCRSPLGKSFTDFKQ